MKKTTAVLTAVFAAVFASAVQAADISITVDGAPLKTDVPAQIVDGRTFVPMRSIFEALGAKIDWDAQTKSVTATKDDNTIVMQINSSTFSLNGSQKALDVPAFIQDGRTLVPLRAVSESLDCAVEWNSETKTVGIDTAKASSSSFSDTDVIDFLSAEDIAPAPISSAGLNEAQALMHEEGRYNFEQSVMPQALFNDDGTLAGLIKNDPHAFGEKIDELWNKSVNQVIADYMINSDETFVISSEEDLDKYLKLFQSNCYLYGSDNIGFSMTKSSDKYYTLLEMAPDDYLTACNYILITYADGEGFKYYTLEKSLDGIYLVCNVTANGHSSGNALETPDKRMLLETVINGGFVPTASLTY